VRAESIIHASLLATVTDAPPYGMVASHHRRAVSTPDELFRERERLDQRAIIRRPVSFSSCMCGPAPATVNPAAHACARIPPQIPLLRNPSLPWLSGTAWCTAIAMSNGQGGDRDRTCVPGDQQSNQHWIAWTIIQDAIVKSNLVGISVESKFNAARKLE
jgi:hypothetical protein